MAEAEFVWFDRGKQMSEFERAREGPGLDRTMPKATLPSWSISLVEAGSSKSSKF